MRRRLPLVACLLVALGVAAPAGAAGGPVTAVPASVVGVADTQSRYEFAIGLLSSRLVTQLPTFAERPDLDDVAQRQAEVMARSRVLFHNPYLTEMVCCWSSVGEIVGAGADIPSIYGAFMTSPRHRSLVLNPAYDEFGVGAVRGADGTLWVAGVFRRNASAGGGLQDVLVGVERQVQLAG